VPFQLDGTNSRVARSHRACARGQCEASARIVGTALEEVGEVAFPPKYNARVSLARITQAFAGFDRNPYFATFQAGKFTVLLATVHLFFGSDQKKDMDRRALETFAVARWADREATSKTGFTRNLVVLGDFNMPKADPADPLYQALTRRGLQVPAHSSQVGSSIASDAHYDQIAFFPGDVKNAFSGSMGVFDYDQVLFPDLFQTRGAKDYKTFAKYHISDHRPMWMEFRTA